MVQITNFYVIAEELEPFIVGLLNSYGDNLELFPYFVSSIKKEPTEQPNLSQRAIEVAQDFFDLDHLAVLENKAFTATTNEWNDLEFRDRGLIYAYIKEGLWDLCMKSTERCVERLIYPLYSDFTGSGPDPSIAFRLILGKIADTSSNIVVAGIAGASYDIKTFAKGLGVYKQNSEGNFSVLGGMGASILAPSTLTISKQTFNLTKQNWDLKPQIAKFIATVASWFAYVSTSAGMSTESVAKLESKEVSVIMNNGEKETKLEIKTKSII